jgi:hypothetical protein
MYLIRKLLAVFIVLAMFYSVAVSAQIPSIDDTEWVGSDSSEKYITTFRFEKSGLLAYYYNGVSYRNGTWKQNGASIYFEMNGKFREFKGTVKGDQISGDSWNKKGNKWETVIYKYNRPDSDAGKPVKNPADLSFYLRDTPAFAVFSDD